MSAIDWILAAYAKPDPLPYLYAVGQVVRVEAFDTADDDGDRRGLPAADRHEAYLKRKTFT